MVSQVKPPPIRKRSTREGWTRGTRRGVFNAAQTASFDVVDRHPQQLSEEEEVFRHGNPSGRTGKPERDTGGADFDRNAMRST